MAQVVGQQILRDPALFYWILFPITIVMILTGVLRHYATLLLQSAPKPLEAKAIREQKNYLHGLNLRTNANQIPLSSFTSRKNYLVQAFQSGTFLKDPDASNKPPANPMSDPNGMDAMMNMMKGNMMMIVPQTVIMGWINAFFSGFVIMKLPFPLTIRFKSMLQSGVMTRDMDVRWVSSLSWYFLCLFGLRPVFTFILGNDNAADQTMAQVQQMNPQANTQQLFGPGQDPAKMYLAEAENLEVMVQHEFVLDGIVDRILARV
ncbi:ER membrane complex subunit 3 [Orbilia oligospora]|uniref:ER membrane protein complex subunit 3 n=1 Tax=Orbilia oligospora TaxID=2813651 RepID=A0A6G1MJI4_ORBOL|nr:ER membrane complex subunit 3 [Orbilia oligospora]KAF3196901.1 ER membrane complex subunit 3 [Orbilia oligospora]KAF3203006.1 ER membrane complex subunit 3 [Orbilia oligospora]KAF3206680.1 ER membrane complex subunit 3 [Orbilia oligospora]KAF3259577.1 ER membrane complex subunit 3 [Orbilia oligospora]